MNGIGQRKTLMQTGTAFSSARSVAWNYDCNGNVTQYLTSTGSIATSFEYDPFGRLMINNFTNLYLPYRYSTKPHDQPTGFYYYGYRYYDPTTGRWPSRDPIGENGGVNLYGMVRNNPFKLVDILGLSSSGCPEGESKDDAGRCCCPDDMTTVTMESKEDGSGLQGHSWLDTEPNNPSQGAVGHYPNGGKKGKKPGDRADNGKKSTTKTEYTVCPETKDALKDSMDEHSDDGYDAGNYGDRNCTGWACERLQDAGLDPPLDPEQQGIGPRDHADNPDPNPNY